ncbi:MAG: gcvH [Sphingomonas bacterium]|nr:glycine cleavage system protein GcvH [Sphingomonas bacterium]MDB5689921.1 gcvH [Sphingomonas bacterium]
MDVYYTRQDDWIAVHGDVATVGITDHAQKQLGDILFVQLPPIGTELVRGREAALVESIKAAADLFAPISGTVTETNPALEREPALVNTAPEAEGWMFRMTIGDPAELVGLLGRDLYLARIRRM